MQSNGLPGAICLECKRLRGEVKLAVDHFKEEKLQNDGLKVILELLILRNGGSAEFTEAHLDDHLNGGYRMIVDDMPNNGQRMTVTKLRALPADDDASSSVGPSSSQRRAKRDPLS